MRLKGNQPVHKRAALTPFISWPNYNVECNIRLAFYLMTIANPQEIKVTLYLSLFAVFPPSDIQESEQISEQVRILL